MTKTDTLRRCKELIATGGTFDRGSEEFAFLFDLLQRHPRAATKTGPGVAAFRVGNSTKKGRLTQCFYLRREDGTIDDFSYFKCLGWKK